VNIAIDDGFKAPHPLSVTTIGFVGLGPMGAPIAGRFLAAGNVVHGTDRTRSTAGPLVERGMFWRDSPRAVAAEVAVIFSRVTDTAALEAISAGPDGILAGLRPGSVWVDMSIVSPARSREIALVALDRGAVMLEAPVSGSASAAETGNLVMMVGGDAAAFARVAPLLRQLAKSVKYVGDNGEALWISRPA
jgi:3-hydroxyisobutyrate dehydrogenase-like beta-hydroxyacid dehydrogenase